MQQHLTEQITLFASVLKWTVYASLVGLLVGLGTTGFLRSLAWTSAQYASHHNYFLFLPATLLVSTTLVRWLAPDAAGHGTEKVIEAVHKRMGKIPLAVVPVKLVATVLTLAGGGSAGKEGPCAQIGAGLASGLADILRVADRDRRKLVICGISAGFATVFGTPIAGALFGVEVLVLGQVFYDVLFPSFVAGIVGYHVATSLGVSYPHPPSCLLPQLSSFTFLEIILLGAVCGLVSLLLIELMKFGHRIFERLPWHWSLNPLLGGGLLILVGTQVSTNYLGLGLDTIESGLNGAVLPAGAAFWKSVTTSITLGCGGSGGILTPIFFIGTATGNLYAQLVNPSYLAAFSCIGMVALLAGSANTPIAASVMAMELFGPQIAPFAAIACMVSFLIVGYRSIYPSQLLGIQKSASLSIATGRPVGCSGHPVYQPRDKTLVKMLLTSLGAYRNRWRK
ncbi:permease [Geomonas limicola]|uniref:Permease n=1 Tax=Geomonas limicola TaxID=2740186 RepID=A0A6V8NC79_9BACT|nr:chloride channel protein [Geomonas limicola]GFO70222.1 permease [Geomonas limicola]